MAMIAKLALGLSLLLFLEVTGCASNAPRVTAIRPIDPAVSVEKYHDLDLTVTREPDVEVREDELARLRQAIIEKLRKNHADRFQVLAGGAADGDLLEARVRMTRYDRGNAFARAMLAGLGQIHINGRVLLVDHATADELGEFEVKKTFAWGGLYGMATTMADVERGFAEAVANAIAQ